MKYALDRACNKDFQKFYLIKVQSCKQHYNLGTNIGVFKVCDYFYFYLQPFYNLDIKMKFYVGNTYLFGVLLQALQG